MTLNDNLESVLFDLDGTLLDTAPDFVAVVNELLLENNKNPIDANTITSRVSEGARALVKHAFEIDSEHANFQRLYERLLELYKRKLRTTESTLYPGLESLLVRLDESLIPWGIVTNKPELYAKILLSQLNLLKRCAVLICPDHVRKRKPDPEPIHLACQKLKCNENRSVYIGDHVRDIRAAKSANVTSIAAAYGYLNQETRVENWKADFIVRNSTELEQLLNSLRFR